MNEIKICLFLTNLWIYFILQKIMRQQRWWVVKINDSLPGVTDGISVNLVCIWHLYCILVDSCKHPSYTVTLPSIAYCTVQVNYHRGQSWDVPGSFRASRICHKAPEGRLNISQSDKAALISFLSSNTNIHLFR